MLYGLQAEEKKENQNLIVRHNSDLFRQRRKLFFWLKKPIINSQDPIIEIVFCKGINIFVYI